ncbi:MAG: hypothetical protein ACM3S1_05350 [Hyphomicrobiales bacterium]
MTTTPADYPVSFDVDYPEQLDRLTTAFRIILGIPIFIVIALLSGPVSNNWDFGRGDDARTIALGGAGILFLPTLLMLLFRRKYPGWWFGWNLQLTRLAPASVPTSHSCETSIPPRTKSRRSTCRSNVPMPNS